MIKLTRKEKARRTTIVPAGFKAKEDCIVIGEKYKQVLTFFKYPDEFVEGFLASMVTSPHYALDLKISHADDLDEASALKSQLSEKKDKYKNSKDDVEKQTLYNEIMSLENYINMLVGSHRSTLNVSTQAYVTNVSKSELEKKVQDIKNDFSKGSTAITLRNIKYIQEGLYKNNSPLFIKPGLRKEVAYSNGQIMSSLSCAGLWPFIYNTLEDPEGKLIGRELTNGGKIIFNQFLYKNYKELAQIQGRPNGNMIVVGRSGMGKTTIMVLLLIDHIIHHRYIIWIDPENKNRNLCNAIGGNYIEIGIGGQLINIFDLKPITTEENEIEAKDIMYDTQTAIFNVVEEIKTTFETLWPKISENELAMIGEITVETYKSVGIDGYESFEHYSPEDYPTFTNFTATIKQKIEMYSKEAEIYKLEISALKKLELKMRQITGYADVPGEWGRYFNGITTIKKETLEKTRMIAIGTKHLFHAHPRLKNALLRQIFKFSESMCLDENEESVLCIDEEHMFISEEILADVLGTLQRRVRKYNTVTLTGTQQVIDYASPKILTHGKAIFDNAIYQFYMNLTKDGVTDLSKLVTLTDEEKLRLQSLSPHTGLFFCGQKRIPLEVLATDAELSLML